MDSCAAIGRGRGVCFAADDALGFVGVDIRIVEEPHLEFPEEHGRDEFVELRFFEHALLHEFDQIEVAVGSGSSMLTPALTARTQDSLLSLATKWPWVSGR